MELSIGVIDILRRALQEDIGPGDLTTELLIPDIQTSRAVIMAKGAFLVAGVPFAEEVFRVIDPLTTFVVLNGDGSCVEKNDVILEISGKTRTILTGERTALNIIQRLSGIAMATRSYVEKIGRGHTRIADTRKTAPGLRVLDKYAVRIGGGANHRFGLFDGILIKDNHIAAAGSITAAVQSAQKAHHLLKIEVEVKNLDELREALAAGAEVIMLDNMTIDAMREAVAISRGRALIEASGNITLENVKSVAETGVDLISVGAITHSAPAVDVSLKIIPG